MTQKQIEISIQCVLFLKKSFRISVVVVPHFQRKTSSCMTSKRSNVTNYLQTDV
jgi:hypothetical protein